MFFINFMGTIRFTRDRANDYYYARIAPLIELSTQKDLVIIGRSWVYEPYLRRYGKAQVLSLDSVYRMTWETSQSLQRVQAAIDDNHAKGGRVFISQEAVKLEEETIQDYSGITVFYALWDRYRQRWKEKETPQGVVYVLQ
jgi:hypothetical protein